MDRCVENESFNKSRWVLRDVPLDQIEYIVQRHSVPEIVARILIQRGVGTQDVAGFLNPTLKKNFPDPFSLKGMGDMAEDVAIAVEAGQNFSIFGDFDVDGATSSAVLYRFLNALGRHAPIYIPDRLAEGYGPNIDALKTLKNNGADVVMMLDCGTTAFDVVAAGTELGLKIIIIDHHEAQENLPDCWHVINPKRRDDRSGLDMLAAVGVTFMACVAINNRLRARGFYSRHKIDEPNLKAWLDIVALGTVCDMVPITGVNRLFVKSGLCIPHAYSNVGIKVLMEIAGKGFPVSPSDCGYALGPRINAGSRVHQADLGARLLCSDDAEEAKNIAWTLDDCNKKRKIIQKEMEAHAISIVDANGMQNDALILVEHKDWHPGLSGLVAGRLKEQYDKPSCVVTYTHDLSGKVEGRGSGRSIPGVDIAKAFIDARGAGLLEKGGGHAMAGGFTVLPEKVADLRCFLNHHIKGQMDGGQVNVETLIDGVLTIRGVTVELVEMLHDHIGPFGQEQPEPVFLFENIRIRRVDVRGGSHISLQISDWEGGTYVKAMAFGAVGTPLGSALMNALSKPISIIGQLKVNEWQGRKSAELHIIDAAYSSMKSVSISGQETRSALL